MENEFKKIEVSDELNFYHNGKIKVTMGENENEVELGLMVEIMNIVDVTGEGDENYPFIVSFGLMAKYPHKSFNEEETKYKSLAGTLYDCNSYMGSVPVDHVLINAINGGLSEILPLFNVQEAKKVTVKNNFGTIAAQNGPGTEFSYLMFSSEEAAQKLVDYVLENRAAALSMMVGFILDRPINMIGNSGWSQIETMIKGK